MGLSGRKAKQRIGKDPRNLSWADDASSFGQTYLAKFGWDASKGLGASGEGRTTAIKATQKLDMLGIGMQHQKDPNGIAWRQQRDFENLLRRLNDGTDAPGPFCKAYAEESESLKGVTEKVGEDEGADNEEGKDVIKRKEKKKRKRESAEESEEDNHGKKRRKKRKKSESEEDGHGHAVPDTESEPPPPCPPGAPAQGPGSAPMNAVTAPTPVVIRAPPRTHRARMIAAKRMASSNSNALAEILGIPSSSTSSLSSPYPSTAVTLTPTPVPGPGLAVAEAQEPLQQLTTSSQSVGDYFKAKLSAKRQPRPTYATADAPASAPPPTPSRGDDDDHNRAGLGSGGGASRAPLMNGLDERVRGGIGASSSKFAAMFTLGQPVTDTREENVSPAVEPVETGDAADRSDDRGKSEKKRAKEERRRKKEERRGRRAEAGQLEVGDAVVDMPIGQAKKKKRHELAAPDGYSQDTQPSSAGGIEVVQTKKRKKGEKDKKSAKPHRRPEE